MQIRASIVFLMTFLLFSVPSTLQAQETVIIDSLEAARITALRRQRLETGAIKASSESIRSVVSPLGEGDALRWIQTLPGVATGADGTSSYYVRGSNAGGNLLTIDGVPVFGYSHILGLTTLLPLEVTESASFIKGGFVGGQGNYVSSHLDVHTIMPSSGFRKIYFSLNNFLAGGGAIVPIGKKCSVIAAGRISPISMEYKALKSLQWNGLQDVEDFGATVYDLYGKVVYRFNERHYVSLSGLGSRDRYSFGTSDASNNAMGWGNLMGILQSHHEFGLGNVDLSVSYNNYQSVQEQKNIFNGKENDFYLQSSLKETTLSGEYLVPLGRYFRLGTGIKVRWASFAPSQRKEEDKESMTQLTSGFLRGSFQSKTVQVDGSIRMNWFKNYVKISSPDYNISAKWQIIPLLALEGTYDRMSQFYHTLEGLPLGWSMDLLIPSSVRLPIETMTQGYLGFVFTIGKSTLSAGAFTRKMENLIYYKNASDFFSGVQTEWVEAVDIGNGDASGVELLYEFNGKDFYAKASATLAKATRKDFKNVNEGRPFHAPFDRRFVANIMAEWRRINLTFIYQDGNWVNGRGETYDVHLLGDEDVTLQYFSGVNNHQMSPIIRLDVGYRMSWKGKHLSHDLNIGVCNVLNHFNPYTVYYDTKMGEWKEIALLPILPNFSYRLSF